MVLALRWMFCTDLRIESSICFIVINWLVFTTVVESVYSAVRTDSLYKADCVSFLKVNLRVHTYEYRRLWKLCILTFSVTYRKTTCHQIWKQIITVLTFSAVAKRVAAQSRFQIIKGMLMKIQICWDTGTAIIRREKQQASPKLR
jgi:hypothetical protein